MNAELENKLYEKYPTLFADKDRSPRESCMAFGLECGDGWYAILEELCARIANREQNLKLNKREYTPVKFDQIKEKFGGLRVYYSGGDDYIAGAVALAEDMSYRTCERCGHPGEPSKTGWIMTLCAACQEKR